MVFGAVVDIIEKKTSVTEEVALGLLNKMFTATKIFLYVLLLYNILQFDPSFKGTHCWNQNSYRTPYGPHKFPGQVRCHSQNA